MVSVGLDILLVWLDFVEWSIGPDFGGVYIPSIPSSFATVAVICCQWRRSLTIRVMLIKEHVVKYRTLVPNSYRSFVLCLIDIININEKPPVPLLCDIHLNNSLGLFSIFTPKLLMQLSYKLFHMSCIVRTFPIGIIVRLSVIKQPKPIKNCLEVSSPCRVTWQCWNYLILYTVCG